MPAVEILGVSAPEELPEELRAARVRLPEKGSADVFAFELAGMVIPHEGQCRSIEVRLGTMVLRELPVSFPRTGLSRSFPDLPDELVCGFRGRLGALLLPTEFELEVVAVLEGGKRVPIGSISGRRAHPRPSFEPAFRPVMLTSVGRTGTSWVMRMLGAHPSIVVDQHHPHEGWPARYWTHMLRVLSAPGDPERSVTRHTFDFDIWHVGQNPFYGVDAAKHGEYGTWFGRTHVDRLASFCLQNVEDWYAIAARDQGKQPVYFAEKNFLRTPVQAAGVSDLYPHQREVFLVRDFRDMACSWLSFFAEQWLTGDFEKFLEEVLKPWAQLLVSSWRARGEHAHLVRYEELVSRPAETMKGVFDYLELDSSDRTVDSILHAGQDDRGFKSHRTSPSLEKTVGRWRLERDEPFRDNLNEAFREGLIEFGYAEPAAERIPS